MLSDNVICVSALLIKGEDKAWNTSFLRRYGETGTQLLSTKRGEI
jgi:hypothetical protein